MVLLLVVFATLAIPAGAQAQRPLISANAVESREVPPDNQIEGACGVALLGGTVYVSDYYHHAIDVFAAKFHQIKVPEDNGPCQLAVGPGGELYANLYHQGVERLLPSPLAIDSAESTGVAVDPADGRVYVDDRTHVAVYEPNGTRVQTIGLGNLIDAYGVAVESGRLYVPDAGAGVVKVFEAATSTTTPVASITGFNSLIDATAAVDPTNGHLLVVDNLQPGFEEPQAQIVELESDGTPLGALSPVAVDGEPTGLAVDPASGDLYATSGNGEESSVLLFGPYEPSPPALAPASLAAAGPSQSAAAVSSSFPTGTAARSLSLRTAAAPARSATLVADLPSAGTLVVSGAGLRTIGPRTVEGGRARLHLRLDRRARRALVRSKRGRLAVRAKVRFTPAEGAVVTVIKRVGFEVRGLGAR